MSNRCYMSEILLGLLLDGMESYNCYTCRQQVDPYPDAMPEISLADCVAVVTWQRGLGVVADEASAASP